MTGKKYEVDMCSGPLLRSMLTVSIPLVLSGILQLFFNAADIIVVGRFSGKEALAAVGSTGPLITLIVNLFSGLAIGTNVLAARYIGARDVKNTSLTIHTAICASLICGLVMAVGGVWGTKFLLLLTGTPADVLPGAVIYMRIFFLGMPALMLYNFGAAILRAVGDTKRPLFFLLISGIVNIVCNLFFVIVLRMGVAGVAIATVISETLSAVLILLCLLRADGMYRLYWRQLRIDRDKLIPMLKIGLPAGLQGALFSISNVLIQSSVNSFGSIAIAGNTAAENIEGFVDNAVISVYQATLSFTSQNMGAQKYSRINRIGWIGTGIATVISIVMGAGAALLGRPLLSIYNSDPQVIAMGIKRLYGVSLPYLICGFMDVLTGMLRGLGYSVAPMVISLAGGCGLRILWILTAFVSHRSLEVLYFSYPLSWLVTTAAQLIFFLIVRKKFPKTDQLPDEAENFSAEL